MKLFVGTIFLTLFFLTSSMALANEQKISKKANVKASYRLESAFKDISKVIKKDQKVSLKNLKKVNKNINGGKPVITSNTKPGKKIDHNGLYVRNQRVCTVGDTKVYCIDVNQKNIDKDDTLECAVSVQKTVKATLNKKFSSKDCDVIEYDQLSDPSVLIDKSASSLTRNALSAAFSAYIYRKDKSGKEFGETFEGMDFEAVKAEESSLTKGSPTITINSKPNKQIKKVGLIVLNVDGTEQVADRRGIVLCSVGANYTYCIRQRVLNSKPQKVEYLVGKGSVLKTLKEKALNTFPNDF